jgi:hypothetical protein
MSGISGGLKSTSADEVRLKNYKASLQQKSEADLREIELRHNEDVQRMTESHAFRMEEMKRAYDVQISERAEQLEEALQRVRDKGEDRVIEEKNRVETEVAKVRAQGQSQLDEYKRNSEFKLEKLHKETQAATAMLHDRAKKAAKKEREGNSV